MDMAVIINISDKGKTWKVQMESDILSGKVIGDSFEGKEILPALDDYALLITGGSDSAGFPLSKEVEGLGLRRMLLKKGWGMRDSRKGVRLRKTVRGKVISANIAQVNCKVVKEGKKHLTDVFPEQNKPKEKVKKVEVASVV